MERKTSTHYFLIGFVLAAATAAALVGWWLWQRRQDEQPARAPEPSRPVPRREAPVRATPVGEAAVEEAPADPLQKIRGIGDVYARRLRAAGIRTFADLAALTPDEARTLAQAQSGLADTAGWIEQAKALASS